MRAKSPASRLPTQSTFSFPPELERSARCPLRGPLNPPERTVPSEPPARPRPDYSRASRPDESASAQARHRNSRRRSRASSTRTPNNTCIQRCRCRLRAIPAEDLHRNIHSSVEVRGPSASLISIFSFKSHRKSRASTRLFSVRLSGSASTTP